VDINMFVTLPGRAAAVVIVSRRRRNTIAVTRDDWRCRGRPRSFGKVRMVLLLRRL
jgi:hypothetical protein